MLRYQTFKKKSSLRFVAHEEIGHGLHELNSEDELMTPKWHARITPHLIKPTPTHTKHIQIGTKRQITH